MVTTSLSIYRENTISRGINVRTRSSQGNNTVNSEPTSLSAKTTKVLFDFTRSDCTQDWTEYSDTIKTNGMSKAVLTMQRTPIFQRAVLFTLFNPRSQRLGFAAVCCETNLNLSEYKNVVIKCRGQGVNLKYKMLLRHKGQNKDTPVYGQVFLAPTNEFELVKLPLVDFKPYFRGKELPPELYTLDLSSITNMALKIDNGPYLPDNQPGPSSLEIDWIKSSK